MHFAKAQATQKPSQFSIKAASVYVAFFFVVAATAQLFAFENFPQVIESYGTPFDNGYASLMAAIIVILEVFAIPSLLWMKMSPLMRVVSATSGWLVLLYWLFVGIWQGSVDYHIANAGLFGAEVIVPQGWWLVSYCLILLILLGYVSWSSRLPQSRAV